MKDDTSRPHTPVIPGQYAPPSPVYAPAKGEATLLHLDPPATRFPLPTPVDPTVTHVPTHVPLAPAPLNIQRNAVAEQLPRGIQGLPRRRGRKLLRPRARRAAQPRLVRAPHPIPFCHLGTFREKLLGMAVFQRALEDMNPQPQIVWDVPVRALDVGRHRPSVPVLRSDVDEEADEEARAAGP